MSHPISTHDKANELPEDDEDREVPTLNDTITECERCGGTGSIEIMGDGANFEWDVIGYKKCPDCRDD